MARLKNRDIVPADTVEVVRPQPVGEDSRGIIGSAGFRRWYRLERYPAGPELDGLISWFWVASWALSPGQVHVQHLLTHPCANLYVSPPEIGQLAARAGISVRTLQRMFARYAGVSPTWVLRRYRLLEAAEAAGGGRT